MPGRKFGNEGRYGFNGKERDKDMNSLTVYDYGFRIYNPAIGRFLSVDPLTDEYPWYTPYQFAGNMPIWAIDVDGLEPVPYMGTVSSNGNWLSGALLLPGNTYVKAYNTFAATANSANDLVQKSSSNGLGPGLMGWIDGIGEDLKDWWNGTKEYHTKTPVSQQLKDAKEWVSNPDNVYGTMSDAAIIYGTYRLQAGIEKDWSMKGNVPEWGTSSNSTLKPTVKPIRVVNTTPQIGGEFGSKAYTMSVNGRINLTGRAVTNGTFDFVVTNDGKLIVGTGHYNLSGGAGSVKAAGQIQLYKGKIMNINNSSGHYQPSVEQARTFGDVLMQTGADVKRASLNIYSEAGKTVEKIKL